MNMNMDKFDFQDFASKNMILIILIVIFVLCCIYWLITTINTKTVNVVFGKENFSNPSSECTNAGKHKIVLYYTNWCGYSKMFLPEWEKFEEYVNSNNNYIAIEKIDCEKNQGMCSKVNGFPTVIMYGPNGNQYNMEKFPRTKQGLIDFVKSISGK